MFQIHFWSKISQFFPNFIKYLEIYHSFSGSLSFGKSQLGHTGFKNKCDTNYLCGWNAAVVLGNYFQTQFETVALDWRTFGEADMAHVIIKICCPHGWSIQSTAHKILKLNELLKMFEPFSSILHQIWQNLTQHAHKFNIRIMESWHFEILRIRWGMILREIVVKIVDMRA